MISSPRCSRKVLAVVPTRLLKAISALLIAALALSACASRPGTAAVVDGRTVLEKDLSQTSAELAQVLGEQVSSQAVLQILIVAPTMIQVSSRNGMSVSADQAEDFLDEQAATGGQEATQEYGPGTVTVGRYLLLDNLVRSAPEGEQIGTELQEEINELQVELSPRYGEWTPEQGPVPVHPEWILEPAAPQA